MAIPEAVQRQAEEADRAIAEAEAQQHAAAVEETPAPAEAPVVEAPAPALEAPAVDEVVPRQEYDRVTAELARTQMSFRTLRGKYDAEVPRMAEEVRSLRTMIEEIRATPQAPAQPEKPAHLRYVDEKDLEGADADVIKLQAAMMRGIAEDAVKKMQGSVRPPASPSADIEREVIAMREQRVWDQVERLHPGAQAMNDAVYEQWETFLTGIDALSGQTYASLGLRALQTGNAIALNRLIDTYLSTGASIPESAQARAAKLDGQVRPETARTPSRQGAASKPTFKQSEYDAFVRQYTQGAFKGRPEEAKRLAEQFENAALEGRIRPG